MTVTIIGGAGYTGGMLLRILMNHPNMSLSDVVPVSSSHAGQPVESAHPDLVGTGLVFADAMPSKSDVIFLCTGHGKAADWMASNDVGDAVVIDLSADHRLEPRVGVRVAGSAIVMRIRTSKRIANPGCFATCIELGLLRLGRTRSTQVNRSW